MMTTVAQTTQSQTVAVTLPDGRTLHMSQVGVSRAIARGIELGYLDAATGVPRKQRPGFVPHVTHRPPT